MKERVSILIGDSEMELKAFPENSFDLCVTSPPYDNLRRYDGHAWNFKAIAMELLRVLKPGGVCCWNVSDQTINGGKSLSSFRQALFFVDECGFRMHERLIYEKTNFSHPEHVRYHQLFEDVFILSKGKPRTFNPIKDKKNVYAGSGTYGVNTARQADGSFKQRPRNIINELGKRGNVWRGKTRGQESICEHLPHPAMMPLWLAKDLILSYSQCGDLVLDPFAGSGTTGKAALELGRRCVLIEANPNYREVIGSSTQEWGLELP